MTYDFIKNSLQTPCYIFDTDIFEKTVKDIKRRLSENVNLCFSLKANPWLIEKAYECADNIETCSQGEIEICRRAFDGKLNKVLYGGVMKEESDINYALESGIVRFSIESIKQLNILARCAEEKDITAKVLLRITSGNQFGMDIDEVCSLFDNNEFPKNLTFCGIHYFSGTGRLDVKSVLRDFDALTDILSRLDYIGIKEVEYGSGIGVDYFTNKSNSDVWDSVIAFINKLSEKYKVTYESGRALSAFCGQYVTKIIEVRRRADKYYYITNGGKHQIEYYSGLFSKMKTPQMSIVSENTNVKTETVNAAIVGALCTIGDVLAYESEIKKADDGDYVVFNNCGGYSVTENIALFLTRDIPAVYLLENGKLTLLRQKFDTVKLNSRG